MLRRQSVGACFAKNDTRGLGLRGKQEEVGVAAKIVKASPPLGRTFVYVTDDLRRNPAGSPVGWHPATRNLVRMPCSFNKRAIFTAKGLPCVPNRCR